MICSINICLYIIFFFFFQAEDGIRDADVTGVQTCALPISGRVGERTGRAMPKADSDMQMTSALERPMRSETQPQAGPAIIDSKPMVEASLPAVRAGIPEARARSEERRVGKEGRCGGSADQ